MLGEMIAELQGTSTGIRVLPDGKTEGSMQARGKLLGLEATFMGTYISTARPSGVFFGDGQGVFMTNDGEMVSATGQGIGKPTGHGMATSWRVSMTFQTTSQKLARLNGTIGVIEAEFDENGKTSMKIWEWK